MNPSQHQLPGITQDLIELLADAKRNLPPMNGREQEAFYASAFKSLVDAFWERYMLALPPAALDEFAAATTASGYEAIGQWQQRYADFDTDEQARRVAKGILQDLSEVVPALLKKDFDAASFPLDIRKEEKDLPPTLTNAA